MAFLGVSTAEPTDGGPGATIVEIVPGGPAAQAGLAVRDGIVTFDGKPVDSAEALSGLVQDRRERYRASAWELARSFTGVDLPTSTAALDLGQWTCESGAPYRSV